MPQERKPPFDFKAVPTKSFMRLGIEQDFDPNRHMGVKKGEGGEADYTWYMWIFVTPDDGNEWVAFPHEDLHKLFVKLGFRAGTKFGLKRISDISETTDRAFKTYAVWYDGQEYKIDGNGEPSEPLAGLKDKIGEGLQGRKIPTNKEDLLKQENDKDFEAWCEKHEKAYEAIMNIVLDKDLDRFGKRFPKLLEDDKFLLKLELELLANARATIITLLINFDKNGGKP